MGDDIFSPALQKIEKEIIDFLTKTPILFTKDPFVNQIRALFFTRKSLTQNEIKKLTKLSSGKISQVLRVLRYWGLVEKTSISSTGEYTYSMDLIQTSLSNYFKALTKEMAKSAEPLREIKDILETEQENIKDLRGYDQINKLVPLFLKGLMFNIEIMKDFYDIDFEE